MRRQTGTGSAHAVKDYKMKFAVHLFPTVRVKVVNIEANSVAEAVEKAETETNLHEVLDNPRLRVKNVEGVEWDEGQSNFLLVDALDEEGKVIDGESEWLDGDGSPLVDGLTVQERKAAAADAAGLFWDELLESFESLTNISEDHGPGTLADLMYLQAAILKSSSIDSYPVYAADLVKTLPSGERWAKFMKPVNMVQRESSGG